MGKSLSKLKREHLKRQITELVILGGYTDAQMAEKLGISSKTVFRYRQQIYEEFGDFLQERNILLKNVLLSDFKSRDEAWKQYIVTKNKSWLRLFNKINESIFDKLAKCGKIDIAPEKIEVNNLTDEYLELNKIYNDIINKAKDKDASGAGEGSSKE